MRGLILLTFFAAISLFAVAARPPLTVAQLKQLVSDDLAANKKDTGIAGQLNSVQLSEQLTGVTLDAWMKELKPGPKTALALSLLSDLSLFLDLPPSEVPAQPAPGPAEQQSIVTALAGFAADTLGHLPKFIATRTTRYFDNTPEVTSPDGNFQPVTDLHFATTYSQEVTYRDGQEVATGEASDSDKSAPPFLGVTSTGEFGPLLELVLGDLNKGTLNWTRWELSPQGRVAVFSFAVKRDASHFQLDVRLRGRWGMPLGGAHYETPAYHGSLSILPETGQVVRLRVQSDLDPKNPVKRADMLVDYATVQIGEHSYMCPVRSVTIFSGTAVSTPHTARTSLFLWLNEVTFTNYHRFGSTMKILATTPQQ